MKAGMIDRFIGVGVLVLLAGAGTVRGELVEVPLDCAGHYEWLDTWTTELDLGVEFSQIDNVYIDWFGEIRAELVEGFSGGELAIDGMFMVDLYDGDIAFGMARVVGGKATYSYPEAFSEETGFEYLNYVRLLDGQARIEIRLLSQNDLGLATLEYPFGDLFGASLFIEGQIVPEPTVVLILLGGTIWMRARRSRMGRG